MTPWDSGTRADLEQQVTELLNRANRSGTEPEAVVVLTAKLLCLLALATRPAGVPVEQAQRAVMELVWRWLTTLAGHPFVATARFH